MFPRALRPVHLSRLRLRPLRDWSALPRLQKRELRSGTQLHHPLILTDLPEVTSCPKDLAASLMEIRNARLGQTSGPFRPQHCLTEASRVVLEKRAACVCYDISHQKCAKSSCSRPSLWPIQLLCPLRPCWWSPVLFRCRPLPCGAQDSILFALHQGFSTSVLLTFWTGSFLDMQTALWDFWQHPWSPHARW